MRHFPIFVGLHGRDVLVVGGGEPAVRKVRLLRDAGARVTVVAPALGPELARLAAAGLIRTERRPFEAADVAGRALVFAATDIAAVDATVVAAASAAGLHVNAVDRPSLSSFIMPAIVDRDPITVAISSAGTAPVLARSVRAAIEAALPPALGRLADFAERFRGAVKASIGEPAARRRFWERFFRGPVAAAVLAGDEGWARERMLAEVNRTAPPDPGFVVLVGAGPGDPELLTLGAHRRLQDADLVAHDRGVPAAIVAYARRDAHRLSLPGDSGVAAARLAEAARSGERVVLLVAGDGAGPRACDLEAALRRRGVRIERLAGVAPPAATETARVAV